MKLWEIKAQALRIMYADTDIQFNETDFSSQTIYSNANTREKLIRMEDSIRRGIDMYYQYNGDISQFINAGLIYDDGTSSYKNQIDCSEISNFGSPSRIDINANYSESVLPKENINFHFDNLTKQIYLFDYDYAYYEDDITFKIYYRMNQVNLPNVVDEMTFDLDTLNIPGNVQRQLPLYIKSELYEQDEPNIAKNARNEFIQFLIGNQRKNFSKKVTKVKKVFPWGSE